MEQDIAPKYYVASYVVHSAVILLYALFTRLFIVEVLKSIKGLLKSLAFTLATLFAGFDAYSGSSVLAYWPLLLISCYISEHMAFSDI